MGARLARQVPRALHWLFAEWRFAAFAIAVFACWELLLILVTLTPDGAGALGAFAREFRIWCLSQDPSTGTMPAAAIVMMVAEPLVLGVVIAFVWWKPLRAVWATPRRLVPVWTTAAVLVLAGGVALGSLAPGRTPSGPLPFPADRLRTAHEPPSIELVDQEAQPVSLAAQRGKVVLLTGVYASCGLACPMILGQARRAVESLPPDLRAEVTVIAVTLDPEHDTPEKLAEMAKAQQVAAPEFHLATGAPEKVNGVLDALGIERRRDPETGIIDHANAFLLVDRAGRVAYRFSLGDLQEAWLGEALRLLAREPPPAG